jgi:hypothetical protein
MHASPCTIVIVVVVVVIATMLDSGCSKSQELRHTLDVSATTKMVAFSKRRPLLMVLLCTTARTPILQLAFVLCLLLTRSGTSTAFEHGAITPTSNKLRVVSVIANHERLHIVVVALL